MTGKRLRILYVAPYEASAVAVRPRLLMAAMAERHDVHVLTLRRGSVAAPLSIGAGGATFPSRTVDRVAALRRMSDPAYPLQAIAAASRPLSNAVRVALESRRFDLVHLEHIRAFPYLPTGPRPPLLFDAVDCVSQLFRLAAREQPLAVRWLFRLEAGRVARLELAALGSAERVLVASQRDASQLSRHNPKANVVVVTNPVDLDHFTPGPDRRGKVVVMTGKMSFHANARAARWLCDEIWPQVRQQHPDAHLVIAGARPPAALRRCAGADITVTGYVDSLAEPLRSAAVAVAPLVYAVGVQNKVLEALACATPVVATPVAVGDLGVRHGKEVLVASGATELAARINFLLSNEHIARSIGKCGRRYVDHHHTIGDIADQLDAQYHEVLRTAHDHRLGRTDAAAAR